MPEYKEKQTEPITLEDFAKIMETGRFTQPLSHKSFLAFLYWFGVRRSEALERVREDFNVEDGVLIVEAPAKKEGFRKELEIHVDLPFVDLIIQQVDRTRPNRMVWSFSHTTAWKIVKRAMGKNYYPHFFRLNRATQFLEDPKTTTPEMMGWFGWKSKRTVDSYVGFTHRYIKGMRERLKEQAKTS